MLRGKWTEEGALAHGRSSRARHYPGSLATDALCSHQGSCKIDFHSTAWQDSGKSQVAHPTVPTATGLRVGSCKRLQANGDKIYSDVVYQAAWAWQGACSPQSA